MKHVITNTAPGVSELEARLQSIVPKKYSTTFSDDIWSLESGPLDFRIFNDIASRHDKWHRIFKYSIITTAKIVCVEVSGSRLSASSIARDFDTLVLLFTFMSKNNIHSVNQESLSRFVEFYAMHTLQNSSILPRMTPRSGRYTLDTIKRLLKTNTILPTYDIPALLSNIRKSRLPEILSDAIDELSLGELTYRDWIDGGSFNNLTLDYGKYYVEYCDTFFEEHFSMAAAMARVKEIRENILSENGFKPHKNTVNMFNKLLSGESVEAIVSQKPFNRGKVEKLRCSITHYLNQFIEPWIKFSQLAETSSIRKTAKELDCRPESVCSDDDIQRLRFYIQSILLGCNLDSARSLYEAENYTESFDHLLHRLNTRPVDSKPVNIHSQEFYDRIGISREPKDKNISDTFLKKVKAAGLTTLVAFTGWRKSEFGFPLSAIDVERNKDALDHQAHPLRFHVNWHVFKTQGQTKARREITSNVYQRIAQVSTLIAPTESDPCLYDLHELNKTGYNSGNVVTTSVADNWSNFVSYYEGFSALDEFDVYEDLRYKKSSELSSGQRNHLESLRERFSDPKEMQAVSDLHLVEARRKARVELEPVAFYLQKANEAGKRRYLDEYRKSLNGEVSKVERQVKTLLDQRLSEETKTFIRNASSASVKNKVFVREVSNELVSGCLYPTPHAFRHMWAEAVFRRFDGDAGWMIRSNFKHISHSMWLSYIDGKDNRRQQGEIRTRIASTLLKNWVRNEGKGRTGKLHKALRRMFSNTNLIPVTDIDSTIEQYALTEIDGVKANPWGFCISRRRSAGLAKCAVDGSTRPQNAAPSLCLNCVNNITQSSNIDYIVFQCNQHLELLESEHVLSVPEPLREESRHFVKSGLRAIVNLQPDHVIVPRIEDALRNSIGGAV